MMNMGPLPDATEALPVELSIVIVNWNTRELLAQCLDSVARDVGAMPHEVFVVDNASADGSVAMVRERFPWVRLIENAENVGFARANNQALLEARGGCVILLNSDAELQPGALVALRDCLIRHPEAGAAGPIMLNTDRTLQSSYGSLPSVWEEIIGPYVFDVFCKPWGRVGRWLRSARAHASEMRVDRVSFACTAIRRETLQSVGSLDERFEFYSEDYDWFRRLKEYGQSVVLCPSAQVVHHWGGSSRKRADWALRQLYRSKRLYFAKHAGSSAEIVLRLGLALRFAVKAAWLSVVTPRSRELTRGEGRVIYRTLLKDMARPL